MEEFKVPPPSKLNYLNAEYGLKSWLLTKDHKRIALLYLGSISFFFFIGGIYAMLIRLELLHSAGRSPAVEHLQQDSLPSTGSSWSSSS